MCPPPPPWFLEPQKSLVWIGLTFCAILVTVIAEIFVRVNISYLDFANFCTLFKFCTARAVPFFSIWFI